jgi:HB1, ASXL, restriction endonuclease HTH domain
MAKKKMSAPQAALEVLRDEGGPLHVKEITKRVLAGYNTGLKGETPQATIGAKLHTSSKKGVDVRKVEPGTFELLPEQDSPDSPDVPDAETEDDHDPRGEVPNTVVVRQGRDLAGEAKADPKPTSKPRSSRQRRAAKEKVAV